MRKIYLICIVFWRQTDGEIHDELIIVSLFSLHPSISPFCATMKKKKIFTNGKNFSANVSVEDRDLSLHPLSTLFTQLLVIAMIHQEHFSKKNCYIDSFCMLSLFEVFSLLFFCVKLNCCFFPLFMAVFV